MLHTHEVTGSSPVVSTRYNIEDLCNGSTPDSDSVCGGSNPSSPAKIGDLRKKVADFTYYFFTIHSSLIPAQPILESNK